MWGQLHWAHRGSRRQPLCHRLEQRLRLRLLLRRLRRPAQPGDTGIDRRLVQRRQRVGVHGPDHRQCHGDLFPHRGRHCRALLLVDTHSLNPCLLLQSRRPERRLHRRGQLPLCRDRLRHRHPPLRRHDGGNDPRSGDPGDDRVRGRLLLLGLVLLARCSCL